MATSAAKFQVLSDGVAIIAIHNPPMNSLNNNVMAGLQMRFEDVYSRTDVKAIVLTGSSSNFSCGVDLTLFQKLQTRGCDSEAHFVPAVSFMSMIEDGPKPVVAAVHGFVIGAGLELAMGCHSRIADCNAQFSLPDFHNGIIPGLGGTQRLPRLVGLRRALEILWMNRPLTAMEAMEAGLIDNVLVTGDVMQKACSRALDISEKRFPWMKSLERVDRLENWQEALHVLRQARSRAKKDHPNLFHYLVCMDVMEEGIRRGGLAGAVLEERFSHALINSPAARSLMHVFFARRSVTKVSGITDKKLKPRKISCVAILGCGFTGAAIATSFILSKIPTYLKADNKDDLQAGLKLIEENLISLEASGGISPNQLKTMAALVHGATDYQHFHCIDLVVEALEESTKYQNRRLQEVAKFCNPNCILASNYPLMGLNATSANTPIEDRILGMHFVSPAHNTELVEVSVSEKSSAQAVLDLLALVKSMSKLPLVVKSSTSLVVDRLCYVFSMSTSILMELGVDGSHIHALLKDFGILKAPFRFSELQRNLSGLQSRIYLRDSSTGSSCLKDQKLTSPAEEDILDMVLFPVVIEAYQILHGGAVETAEHIDVASILGMGFPSYRGGVIFWARSVGISFIISRLTNWFKEYGNFFKPCTWLDAVDEVKDQSSVQIMGRL